MTNIMSVHELRTLLTEMMRMARTTCGLARDENSRHKGDGKSVVLTQGNHDDGGDDDDDDVDNNVDDDDNVRCFYI